VFEVAAQLSVGLVETAVAAFEGEGFDGVPGVGHTTVAAVVKDQTGPEVEVPQSFLATIFQ
jgi:hypothetical protein